MSGVLGSRSRRCPVGSSTPPSRPAKNSRCSRSRRQWISAAGPHRLPDIHVDRPALASAPSPLTSPNPCRQTEEAVEELLPWLTAPGGPVWVGDVDDPLRPPLVGVIVRGSDCLIRAAGEIRLILHEERVRTGDLLRNKPRHRRHRAPRHAQQPVHAVDGTPHSTHDAYVMRLALRSRPTACSQSRSTKPRSVLRRERWAVPAQGLTLILI